ncbi:transcription factor that binds to CRE motif [Recurvomyces mirabilis]|uniref:Transcription factor that binds to CRE motif n=1 Tax=Recurvomyces mirabilis TaxID=574656 RepID=A0AAE0WWU2_9PEZI|nr:transcription factor that binds to CRE motif [Recurvomyces mirabilis]KAK5159030.1 transcription factor that binds to CRE motif [Recurvomyces mirabilis]
MEAQQLSTITFDNMASSASPQFLNPDDLTSTTSPSPSPAFESDNHNSITMTTSHDAVVVHSKPAKKRKSWGQALPEPKTMLPPRKRAKTDDEKEQRRIERIKRNRAAAHNSRERKRQETETLAVALARANAELNAYRSLHGPLPSHIVLPEVTLDNGETPVPSLMETEEDDSPSPDSPPEDIIKQEPVDSLPSFMAPNFEYIDAKASTQLSLDPTQHSAAMLCDLPCRSSPASKRVALASTTSISPSSFWATLFLRLMTLQLQTCYKTILLAIWSLSPSRMARSMQASILRSTSASTTSSTTTTTASLLLQSMAMARSRAATGRPALRRGASALHARPSVRGDDEVAQRSNVETAVARQGSDSVYHQRAFGKQGTHDQDDGKREGE